LGQCTRDGHALLFCRKDDGWAVEFVAQTYPLSSSRSALAHLRIRQLAELAHGDHYIFLAVKSSIKKWN